MLSKLWLAVDRNDLVKRNSNTSSGFPVIHDFSLVYRQSVRQSINIALVCGNIRQNSVSLPEKLPAILKTEQKPTASEGYGYSNQQVCLAWCRCKRWEDSLLLLVHVERREVLREGFSLVLSSRKVIQPNTWITQQNRRELLCDMKITTAFWSVRNQTIWRFCSAADFSWKIATPGISDSEKS